MNPKLLFCIYTYTYFLYGFAVNGMGPIIPYFSKATGIPFTQFSFLFLLRALGYLFGGYLNSKINRSISPHKLLSIMLLVGGIAFLVSSYSFNLSFLGACFFLGAVSCCNIAAISNICVIRLFEHNDQQVWLQIMSVMFAVGGLVAPLLINTFQEKTFSVLGILFIMGSPILYFIKQPFQQQSKVVACTSHLVTTKIQIKLCLLFMLFIGYQLTFSSWAPSYLLLTDSTDIKTATFSATVLWFANALGRVLLIFVPGSTSKRLTLTHITNTANIIFVTIVVFLGFKLFGVFFGSVSIGIINASVIPLYYAIPSQFQYRLTQSNTAHFMMAHSIGEAVITMPVGYAIKIFGPFSLFICEALIAIISYILYKWLLVSLQQHAVDTEDKLIPLNQIEGVNRQKK